jgi:hypothetical protein
LSIQGNLLLRVQFQPGGKAFAIGLPSDTETDGGSAEEPLYDSFLIGLNGGRAQKLGRGIPIRWIDTKHLLTNAVVPTKSGAPTKAFVIDLAVRKAKEIATCNLSDAKAAKVFVLVPNPAGWTMGVWDWQKRRLVETIRLKEDDITKFAVR